VVYSELFDRKNCAKIIEKSLIEVGTLSDLHFIPNDKIA
jgi:hypothetical protein